MSAAEVTWAGLFSGLATLAARQGDDPLQAIDAALEAAEQDALALIRTELRAARAAAAEAARRELQGLMQSPPGKGSLEERRAKAARRMAMLGEIVAEMQAEG
jgi:hypothetical protein